MALNIIFFAFFLVAFLVACIRAFGFGDYEVFSDIVQSTFDLSKTAVTICIGLIGTMALWLGIMRVGEKGGAIRIITWLISPFFSRLFPGVPKDHPAMGSMMMNFSANMLGLDNAATPLGLKAMKQLQKVNPNPKEASNAQIMFLVLNTSGLTIVPVSIMALIVAKTAEAQAEGYLVNLSPSDVFLPILFATFCATVVGMVAVGIKQRINLLHPIILAYLGGLLILFGGSAYFLSQMDRETMALVSSAVGNFIIFGFIIFFLTLAFFRKVNVFNEFINGAKEGFDVAMKIIPYLVAMLIAIGVFRASGSLDIIINGIQQIAAMVFSNTEWVDALPVAFMKPLSGSGARGALVELWQNFSDPTLLKSGIDSLQGKIGAVMQGSTETTFYTLAVYYGAVKIKNTRYTLWYGLLADLAGIIAAILIAYLFFATTAGELLQHHLGHTVKILTSILPH